MNEPLHPMARTWTVVQPAFSRERLHHAETIFTIGNGYLGTRGTFEEGYPDEIASTLIHGIYNHHPDDLVPDLANAPAWFALRLVVDGAAFRLDQGRILGFRQQLDLRTGILRRDVLWQSPGGAVLRLDFERFASIADQHILAQRVTITALERVERLDLTAYLDQERAVNFAFSAEGLKRVSHWTDGMTGSISPEQVWWRSTTQTSGYQVELMQHVSLNRVGVTWQAGSEPGSRCTLSLAANDSVTLTRIVTIATSRDTRDVHAFVETKLADAVAQGYAELQNAHRAAWERIWNDMDIRIEGDEFAQLAIRFATYHLIIAAPRHDDRVSIGAKTLSGPGYKGHVFWDTELFMLPPFIVAQPEIARNLLMYRYHNLQGARNKAREAGYEGAMFPWESTDTGEETTPRWTLPDKQGRRIRIWTGDHEQHISADIAYAVWQFWRWTGDDAWMRDYGAEIMLDTAVFWGSRAEWNADSGHYELSMQIGPDEFHENINNSVYTNRMAVWNLEHALKTLDWLRDTAPAKAQELTERLNLSEERLAHWLDIIEKMLIPRYDELGVCEQFEGFFRLEPIDVQSYEPRVVNMDVILGHERTQKTQVLKQADVVMLIGLLGEELGSRDELLRNWNTYVPKTAHDSSLSPGMHAWVGAQLGLTDEAYRFWLKAAGLDLENNKGNVRDGIHAAAAGTLWQAVVFGFAGLRLNGNGGWQLRPQLPPWWKAVTFSFYHHGEKHTVTVRPTSDGQS